MPILEHTIAFYREFVRMKKRLLQTARIQFSNHQQLQQHSTTNTTRNDRHDKSRLLLNSHSRTHHLQLVNEQAARKTKPKPNCSCADRSIDRVHKQKKKPSNLKTLFSSKTFRGSRRREIADEKKKQIKFCRED